MDDPKIDKEVLQVVTEYAESMSLRQTSTWMRTPDRMENVWVRTENTREYSSR